MDLMKLELLNPMCYESGWPWHHLRRFREGQNLKAGFLKVVLGHKPETESICKLRKFLNQSVAWNL